MYRPTFYNKHNQSLKKFAQIFNATTEFRNIRMVLHAEETFDNDGFIVDINVCRCIGFDWEYRDKYFENGNFLFESLGQYERKLIKPSIKLSIQCDSTETAIAVAWYEDWLKENPQLIELATDFVDEQRGIVRYTRSFKIYRYGEIAKFKEMLFRAFNNNTFNKSAF